MERAMLRGFAALGIVLEVLVMTVLVPVAILNWKHADYGLLAINLVCMPVVIGGIYMALRALRLTRDFARGN